MYLRRIYYKGYSLSMQSHVTMRDNVGDSPNVLSHSSKSSKLNKVDDHNPGNKHGLGVCPTSNPSPLGPHNLVGTQNTHTLKTQTTTRLSELNVTCNSVKDSVSSGMSNSKHHITHYRKLWLMIGIQKYQD